MKRILFMHQTSVIGGGSFCLLNVIKNIDRTKFYPIVALKAYGSLSEELEKNGIEVLIFKDMYDIPYNQSLWKLGRLCQYIKLFASLPKFKTLLLSNRIDVVYLNNMMICDYLKPAKELGLKTILHVREHWPLDEHIHQLNRARKIVTKCADKLIAINRYSASIFPDCANRTTIVYDWVDMESRRKSFSFNHLFNCDASNLKVVLFTGGFSSLKGTLSVVETFSTYAKGDDFRLLILGGEKVTLASGIKGKLKELLYRCGLYYYYDIRLKQGIESDNRIVCIPGVYEITSIMEQSYCFVSNFGIPHANLALAEALILGVPSLAAATDESYEYSGEGRYALLSKFGDKGDFSSKFVELLENCDLWRTRANAGSQCIQKMFDLKRNVLILREAMNDISII